VRDFFEGIDLIVRAILGFNTLSIMDGGNGDYGKKKDE
jgi:hypothetical protein